MIDLKNEIEKLIESASEFYCKTANINSRMCLQGQVEAYQDCLDVINNYNIITAPKTIKLSEIVDKMNCYVKRNENDIHLYDIEEDLFDEYDSFESYSLIIENNKITNILLSQCDEFKWLYTLWIAGTIIEDDLQEE